MTIEQIIQAKQALIEYNAAIFIYVALACMAVSAIAGMLIYFRKINDDLAALVIIVGIIFGPTFLGIGILAKMRAPIEARAEVANYGLVELKR